MSRTPLEDLSAEGCSRQRGEHAGARRRSDRRRKNPVIANTGDGKGKTTAALGRLLRAWGQGLPVAMFQSVKSKTASWTEIGAYRDGARAQKGIEF
jgi:ATP:corrinoid adenosyltransferase